MENTPTQNTRVRRYTRAGVYCEQLLHRKRQASRSSTRSLTCRPISRHLLSNTPHCFADPSNASTHFTSLSTVLYTAWCGRYQILPVCSFWPLTSPAHPVFFDHSGVLKSFLMLLLRIVICAQLESSCQVTESHGAFTTVPLSTVNCCMVTCGEALTKSCVKFSSCCLTEMESSSQKFFHFRSVSSSIWAQLTWYFAIGNGVTALKTTHPNVVSIATGLLWSPHKIFSPRKQPCNCRDVSNLCFGRERIEYYHKSLWDLVPQLDSWLGTHVGDM
ncbi:hypothetical protein T05_4874 [Trichinella murrelli]|uniref:Uncharacterized protein n=1 Tax=Trichinella murrelli TaxID=144512 RepID=A0A0V0T9G7_9BILA|nr:hypothetical protein T05_4874 [Trichinella murrelli]